MNSSVLGAIIGDKRIDSGEYEDIREQWYEVKQYIDSFVRACKKWSDEYEKEMDSDQP